MQDHRKLIHIDFKNKTRRYPELVAAVKSAMDELTRVMNGDEHLLEPGPACLGVEDWVKYVRAKALFDHPDRFEQPFLFPNEGDSTE